MPVREERYGACWMRRGCGVIYARGLWVVRLWVGGVRTLLTAMVLADDCGRQKRIRILHETAFSLVFHRARWVSVLTSYTGTNARMKRSPTSGGIIMRSLGIKAPILE